MLLQLTQNIPGYVVMGYHFVLKTIPTDTEGFFSQFMTMREKQLLTEGLLESKKKIGGNHAFFRDN